ncbi:MAG: acyl-CoA thioesterase domain-containing protein, partial [Myxococcota bacterium]|nr:acyl-CoA thioesterase domain-containing protein [Myxococcota bacterium]
MTSLFHEMYESLCPVWSDSNQSIGRSINMGWGRIFGGQLLGQALATAQSYPERMGKVHSMHAHFLDVGKVDTNVSYRLFSMRKGRTYWTCRVEGYQEERYLFHAVFSFQQPEEGLSHQVSMPEVPAPEGLDSYQVTLRRMVESFPAERRNRISSVWIERLYRTAPIEVRPIQPKNFLMPDNREGRRLLWFRSAERLPDDSDVHERVLAWVSDFPMLGTSLQPHGIFPSSPKIKMASLDHTIWFYAPFRADEWMLCDVQSPRSDA